MKVANTSNSNDVKLVVNLLKKYPSHPCDQEAIVGPKLMVISIDITFTSNARVAMLEMEAWMRYCFPKSYNKVGSQS